MTTEKKLIALKPCSFGGNKYYIGDEIPAEYVASPAAQEKLGTLKAVGVGTEEVEQENVDIPVSSLAIIVQNEGEEMTLEPTAKGVQDIFNVLTSNVSDAEPIISQMDDGDALILLHLADSRKTIKEAAELRATEIAGEQ